jgi:hypothetical protein
LASSTSCRNFAEPPFQAAEAALVWVTAEEIADMAMPSTCLITELTTFRSARSADAPW